MINDESQKFDKLKIELINKLINDNKIELINNIYKIKTQTNTIIHKYCSDILLSMVLSKQELIYCIKYNDNPYNHICPICGEQTKFNGINYNITCRKTSCLSKMLLTNNDIKNKHQYIIDNYINGDKKWNNIQIGFIEKYNVFSNSQLPIWKNEIKNTWNNKTDAELKSRKEKTIKTCIEKYGCDFSQQNDNIKQKQSKTWHSKTLLEKNAILEKRKLTNIERYNVDHIMKSTKIINSVKEKHFKKFGYNTFANYKKYGISVDNMHNEFEQYNNCTRITKIINTYGRGWLSLNIPFIYNNSNKLRYRYIDNKYIDEIKKYSEEIHNVFSISNEETELYNFIKSVIPNMEIKRSLKTLIHDKNHKYEIDIYIPDMKIGFEFNGSYWHSSINKPKYYHQIKTKLCYEAGIQLIHIWEYDWINDNNKIKSKIRELLIGKDCSKYNWINVHDYNKYTLSDPEKINIDKYTIFNEGKFIKNNI